MAPGRPIFGRSKPSFRQPDQAAPELDDSDDIPDDGSVADNAASLLKVRLERRRLRPAVRRPAPPRPRNLMECWADARRRRALPAPADIEDEAVTAAGYQGVLVKCADDGRFLQVRRVFGSPVPADASADGLPRWDEQNSAMVLEWLSTLGREAVRTGAPVEAADTFPRRRSGIPWRAIVLPLSASGETVDTLLCCVRMEPGR